MSGIKKPHGTLPEKRGPDKNHRGMTSLKAFITVEPLMQRFEKTRYE